jgi:hypothetical protein
MTGKIYFSWAQGFTPASGDNAVRIVQFLMWSEQEIVSALNEEDDAE